MVEKNKIYELIIRKMKCYPNTIVGITDIAYSCYSEQYKCAIVLAVPHKEIISLNNYSEEKFEKTISIAHQEVNMIVYDLITILQKYNIHFYLPPVAQSNEESLIAPFSFKYAAVNAGIGWIGKNGVLVTRKYGPRIRLSAILIDYDLPIGMAISKSMCDDKCFHTLVVILLILLR
ncbi:epoxyqueuosine reductase [Clostridium sp.]|uniref:epoxyqueuosine reductase n=1 Tax=Clostridium sp. TaxID=1506 RepID=UPI0026054C27|nr:epoxyqueuosine reductase [uncultured Clostridium sp.]